MSTASGSPLEPGGAYRFSPSRRGGGSNKSTYYPNPFFDIAQTYMPDTIKELFKWCSYYATTNPLISTVLYKVSAYPITELIYETDNPGLQKQYEDLFEKVLKIRPFVIESNLDRNTFGNSFVMVSFPFRKQLTCSGCKHHQFADNTQYKFRNLKFVATCKECGLEGPMQAKDIYLKSLKGIKLIRLHPSDITMKVHPITGSREYLYSIPKDLRADIVLGRPRTVEGTPQAFIDAMEKKKMVSIRPESIFHSKRPSISRSDGGWGMSLLYPVLKDVFYLQVLKKAQEAIFFGYITPMRTFYPAPQTGSSDPYQYMNLSNWRDKVEGELQKHRADSNYMPIMPIPIGYQNVGGEGRALMLANEIKIWSEHIVAGMGVPPELIFSGVSWSGSNISLRMLENEFLGNREDNLHLVNWVRDQVCAYLDWQRIDVRFRPFKMADDLQRAAFDLQLAQLKKLSWKTLLEERDHDYDDEHDIMSGELEGELAIQRRQMEHQSESQGRGQLTMARYQMKSQELMQEQQAKAQQTQQQSAMDAQAQQQQGAGQEDPNVQAMQQMAPGQQGQGQEEQAQPPPQGPMPGPQLSAVGEGGIVGASIGSGPQQPQQPSPDAEQPDEARARSIVQKLIMLSPEQRGMMLQMMKIKDPELYIRVLRLISTESPEAAPVGVASQSNGTR